MANRDVFIEYLQQPLEIQGEYWLCGIEPGFGSSENLEHDWKNRISKELLLRDQFRYAPSSWESVTSYRYGRAQAKVWASYMGDSSEDWRDLQEGADAVITPFNLYPIAFPKASDHYWELLGAPEITGVSSKLEYRLLCERHIHTRFRKKLLENEPRFVLGFSTSSRDAFARAFAGDRFKSLTEISVEGEGHNPFPLHVIELEGVRTKVMVTHHPSSRSGLNSTAKQASLGKTLRKLAPPN